MASKINIFLTGATGMNDDDAHAALIRTISGIDLSCFCAQALLAAAFLPAF